MLRIFNSNFENELRLLLLIEAFQKPQNADMIYAADFMVTYGHTFGVADHNLNGENIYKFSEFISRRALVQKVLKELTFDGYAKPLSTSSGIMYQLTAEGERLSILLDSDYAKEYRETAVNVIKHIGRRSERTLIAEINKMAAVSLRGTEQ
jgi:hypothetical protein